ncbi:MAG: 4Fe-4S binding protein [Candidatus Hodarchaeales archaeon]|jgi:polyferredoxin
MATIEKTKQIPTEKNEVKWRFNILSIPIVNLILKQRWYQFFLMALNLAFFAMVIFTGFFGSPVGNANLSVVFVWIVWWSLLIMILVPMFGRFWCTMCPIPAFGEWFQRKAPISKINGKDKLYGLGKRWPRRFKNMWIATFGFLSIAIFSGLLTTIPVFTAIMLLGLIIIATITSIIFEKRVFCRYICPVGGFIGLYSQASALEVRVKDKDVCKAHKQKDCLVGNESGYGCPWMVYPGKLEVNTYCGLCMECFKDCPKDNIAMNIRPFGTDLGKTSNRRLDEAYKALVMLGAALLYSTVLLGVNGNLKALANFKTVSGMIVYGAFFLTTLLIIIPGIFWLAAGITRLFTADKSKSIKTIFTNYAYSTVPLGLTTWIGFSLLILLPNWVYIINVINDPFGWGWQILGIEPLKWTPLFTDLIPIGIMLTIIIGLILSVIVTRKTSLELYGHDSSDFFKGFAIQTFFLTIFSYALIYAFIG